MNKAKIFTVDKFLGLNEAADGSTELKLGEAAKMENFCVTHGYNLKTRPGVTPMVNIQPEVSNDQIAAMWVGTIGNRECMVLLYWKSAPAYPDVPVLHIAVYEKAGDGYTQLAYVPIEGIGEICPVKLICMNDSVYAFAFVTGNPASRVNARIHLDAEGNLKISASEMVYTPLILTGGNPAGGGTMLEPINILWNACYLEYSADGEATAYVLPSDVSSVSSVTVDGEKVTGAYDEASHTFTFDAAPAKGINNVRFHARLNTDPAAYEKFIAMEHWEAYNGATDTRLFFYGDGTNICYYTGVPTYGTGLYIPAGNEIAVDSSASAITGMARHLSRLMVFKPDGAFTINYEPVTLADGSVIAGFYVRTASRNTGNEMNGQIQTVENYPRTFCAGNLYEWRHSASYYPDERYAKLISQRVCRTLAAADPLKIVTCDDNVAGDYYMFLNDDAGTVLVNHYRQDAWSMYKSQLFQNIRFAACPRGDVLFANATAVFRFDPNNAYDTAPMGLNLPIEAVFESGFMAFGADYKRKYSSNLWVSLLPECTSWLEITVKTDRRSDYLTKIVSNALACFAHLDFSNFSFQTYAAPKIRRIKLKVKKFVYYQLILRVSKEGASATVLGYDQQVRYSSDVK